VKAEVPAGSGLKIKDVTIPAGKDSADLEVDAEATAKVAADVSVTVTVSGKDVKEDSEKIKVTVK
jgi:hypothetical protein